MDYKVERLLKVSERLLTQLGHQVPPAVETLDELREAIAELRREYPSKD